MHRNVPVLVFANKNDLKTSLSGPEVAQALNLNQIKEKPWHITYLNFFQFDLNLKALRVQSLVTVLKKGSSGSQTDY